MYSNFAYVTIMMKCHISDNSTRDDEQIAETMKRAKTMHRCLNNMSRFSSVQWSTQQDGLCTRNCRRFDAFCIVRRSKLRSVTVSRETEARARARLPSSTAMLYMRPCCVITISVSTINMTRSV